jgi:hypothetical protein
MVNKRAMFVKVAKFGLAIALLAALAWSGQTIAPLTPNAKCAGSNCTGSCSCSNCPAGWNCCCSQVVTCDCSCVSSQCSWSTN